MLIDITKHNIRPTGIVHVGAHHGQEYGTYVKMGARKIVLIEPCSAAFSKLTERFAGNDFVKLHNTACGSKIAEGEMNIERANSGQSNSLLPMGTHLNLHPGIEFVSKEVVLITPLDFIDTLYCDMLVIDTQGYEGEVLKGATETLKQMKWVYVEINASEVYKGCALEPEIDALLNEFEPIETAWFKPGTWGDKLYRRKLV
jgi:FkbM family methyltransferase